MKQARLAPVTRVSRWPVALRSYSSEAPPSSPPFLTKLKGELKTAMKAKDTTRLTVLRSILAATLNASKTDSPIMTDEHLVALLRKTVRSSQDAIADFRKGGRQDLVDKEEAQIRILEEYVAASGITTPGEAELRQIVEPVVAQVMAEGLDANRALGTVMKKLLASGGPLEGKNLDKTELKGVVLYMLKTRLPQGVPRAST